MFVRKSLRMSNRTVIYTVIVFVFVAMIVVLLYETLMPRVSIEEVRQAITLGVSPGASKTAVRTWLASQSYIHYSGDIADKKTGSVVAIEAQIPNTGARWETPQRIRILFFFDSDELSHFEVTKDDVPYVSP